MEDVGSLDLDLDFVFPLGENEFKFSGFRRDNILGDNNLMKNKKYELNNKIGD